MAFDAFVNGELVSFYENEVCESCQQRTRIASIPTRTQEYVALCASCLREIADQIIPKPGIVAGSVPDTEPFVDPPTPLAVYRVARKKQSEPNR